MSYLTALASGADPEYVREVWNGSWFALAIAMDASIFAILIYRLRAVKGWRRAHHDLASQLCVAFSTFVAGSGIRAGYIWVYLHCQNFSGQCGWVTSEDWMMSVAGVLAVIGGLCTVRVLSPESWRPWSWIGAGIIALGMPMAYYSLAV